MQWRHVGLIALDFQILLNTHGGSRGVHIEWAMHSSRGISYVMWKNKFFVLLLSIHVNSVELVNPYVLLRNDTISKMIVTLPILLKCTKHIREVDMANQLRALYSNQSKSHKWWYQIFWFLVNTSIVGMYAIHVNKRTFGPTPRKLMIHLEFKSKLYFSLL